jgi:hypothetical protein
VNWVYHADTRKRSTVIATILIACAAALTVGTVLRIPLVGIAGAGMILLSTMEAFTGCRFVLNDSGASRRVGLSTTFIEWASVVRVVESEDGILLSPLPDASKLDAFRGVFLVMPYHMRTSVLEYIKGRVGNDVRLLGFGADGRGSREADQPSSGRDSETQTGGSGSHGAGDA